MRLARALVRGKERQRFGLYRVEGLKLVRTALQAGAPIQYVLYSPGAVERAEGARLLSELEGKSIPCYPVAEVLWSRLSTTVTPQGFLAIVRMREPELADLLGGNGFLVALDGIQDPGNAGTLLRTAAAAGLSGAIALTGTVDLYGDKTVRAAAGAHFFLPLVSRVRTEAFLRAARVAGLALVLATPRGGEDYRRFNWRRPLVLVLGSEARGASDAVSRAAADKVTIPLGRVESLNVTVAGALLLFEAVRQREKPPDPSPLDSRMKV